MSNVSVNELTLAFHPGYYVKKYLTYQGTKQRELENRLGVSEKTVSKFINGKNEKLSPRIIEGLAVVFGTSEEVWENLNETYLAQLDKIKREN